MIVGKGLEPAERKGRKLREGGRGAWAKRIGRREEGVDSINVKCSSHIPYLRGLSRARLGGGVKPF